MKRWYTKLNSECYRMFCSWHFYGSISLRFQSSLCLLTYQGPACLRLHTYFSCVTPFHLREPCVLRKCVSGWHVACKAKQWFVRLFFTLRRVFWRARKGNYIFLIAIQDSDSGFWMSALAYRTGLSSFGKITAETQVNIVPSLKWSIWVGSGVI